MATNLTSVKRICFFGNFGNGNLGNESTLQAVLYHLYQHWPDAEVTCICPYPEATMRTHNIAAVPIERIVAKQAERSKNPLARLFRKIVVGIPRELARWLEALSTVKNMDMLIVPGTGLLTDAFGILGWGPYNLFKWCLLAKLRGCKLLFMSVGAGPIYGALSRWLIASALHLADFRSYRDISSRHFLEGIGFATHGDPVYPDLAFSLPKAALPQDDDQNRRRPVVGMGLMEYAGRYSSGTPSHGIYAAYLEKLAAFVEWLLGHDYDIRLLIGEILNDKKVIEDFRNLLKERLSTYDERRLIDEPIQIGRAHV
jgi:polysaccharide pyruvyl transferase WcaK-like protein